MREDFCLQIQSMLRKLRNGGAGDGGAGDGGASGRGERTEMGLGSAARARGQRQHELVHDSLLHIQYKQCLVILQRLNESLLSK